MRQVAALNRESWLSRNAGASETDYQVAGLFAAVGMSDDHWRGTSDEEGSNAEAIKAILAEIEV